MKKFYTFEPKNFRILTKMKSFLAVALLLLMAVGNVKAQTEQTKTVSFDSYGFSNAQTFPSGDVVSGFISFSTEKNSATTDPAYYGNSNKDIRLYAGSGNGCALKLSLSGGVIVTAVEIQSKRTQTSTYNFYVDGVDKGQTTASLSAGQWIKLTGINATETVVFKNTNAAASGSDSQIRITGIKVTYIVTSCTVTRTEPVNLSVCTSPYQQVIFGKNNKVYSSTRAEGEYLDTIAGVGGDCDTAVTVNFTLIPASYEKYDTIKAGEHYAFGDMDLTTTTNENYTFTASCGCDSIVFLYLTVLQPVMKDAVNDFVCAGKTYIYRGKNYTEANTYYDTVKMGAGICDTIYTLVLSVRDNATYAFDQTIKPGETWFFTDKYPSIATAGTYKDTLTAANTCDSIVTVTVTVLLPVVLPAEDATTCEGKAYSFRDKDYTVADTYYDTVKMGAGICDTIYTLILTVNPKATYEYDYSMDEGDTYDFFGTPITESGVYPYTLTDAAANGCDSVVTVTVTVIPLPDTIYEETVAICEGETYTFHTFEGDSICTETNIYIFTKAGFAQGGRDSIRILNLTVIEEVRVDTSITICEGQLPHEFFGRTYDESIGTGTHNYTIHMESEGGCDSALVHLTLIVGEEYEGETVEATICESELPYHFGPTGQDTLIQTAGAHVITFHTVLGCDSTVTLKLNVNPEYDLAETLTICESELAGTGYVWRDTVFMEGTTSGIFVFNRETVAHCDSIVTLTLTVNGLNNETVYDTICDSELAGTGYAWRDTTFMEGTESGTFVFNRKNANNCDSIVTYHLTVNPARTETAYDTICASELAGTGYAWRDTTFMEGTTTGTFVFNRETSLGCDSIVTLYLTVNPTYTLPLVDTTICASALPFSYYDTTFDANTLPGVYNYTFRGHTLAGCDSIGTVKLTVNPSYTETDTLKICQLELPYVYTTGLGQTITLEEGIPTGTYDTMLLFNTTLNCDSNIVLHLTVTPSTECQFIIQVDTGAHGTVDGATTVYYQDTARFTIKADNCYYIESIKMDGVDAAFDPYSTYKEVSFDSVYTDHTLAVTFAMFQYTVTATAHGEGTITASDTYDCDSVVVYNYAAAAGYHIDSVKVDEELTVYTDETQTEGSKNFGPIAANHTIDVYYSINHYTVTITAGEHGTVTPSGVQNVVYGTQPILNFTSDGCYEVASITVNGTQIDTTCTTFTLDSIKENTTVDIAFDTIHYQIMVTRAGNGNGTINGNYGDIAGEIACANPVNYDVIADEGSYIDTIIWYGVTIPFTGHVTSWSIGLPSVTQNMELYVVFSLDKEHVLAYADGGLGTVTPADTMVGFGTSCDIQVVADTLNGYHIATIYTGENPENVVWEGQNNEKTHIFTLGSVTTDTTVHATFELNRYTVAATTEGTEGTLTPDSITVLHGHDLGFTAIAGDCQFIDSIFVDGISQIITNVDTMKFTVSNVITPDRTVRVVFSTVQYQMTATFNNVEGTVSDSIVDCGSSYTYTITPNTGYHVDTIYYDAENFVIGETSYTFTNIREDHNIKVVFAINQYEVTASTDGNGTVTPTSETVAHGDDQTFTVTPNDCYHISSITVNDVDYDLSHVSGGTFTVSNITEATTVKINFALDTFQLVQTITGEGTVNEMADTTVNVLCGSDYIFNIAAAEGNHIVSYTVNGGTPVTVDNSESYVATLTDTIKNIQADCTLAAEFAVNTYTIYTERLSGMGTFTPDVVTVNYDADTIIIVTADNANGYHIASVTATGINEVYSNDDHKIVDTVHLTNIRANDTLKAEFALDLHLISVIIEGEGAVAPMDTNITFGDTVTFNITPYDCQYISSIVVDGRDTTITDPAGMQLTFNHVVDTHRLEVTFAPTTYLVKWKEYYPGMPTIREDSNVACGTDFTYEVRAEEGFHIHEVYLDYVVDTTFETEQIDAYDLVIPNVRETHLIEVQFEQDYYSLHLDTVGAGTIVCDSADLSKIYYNTPLQFTVTPEECYEFTSLTINGVNYTDQVVGGVLNWNAIDSGAVVATFSIIRYEMASSVNDGNMGTVTPTDSVDCGTPYTYYIAANEGYHIDTITCGSFVKVLGENDNVLDTLVIANAVSDTAVRVVFSINTYNVTICTPAPENGTLTVNPAIVEHGENCEVTIVADSVHGYHIDTIFCGDNIVPLGQNENTFYVYNINGITSDTTVCASFSLNNYTITASIAAEDVEHLSIMPGDTNVKFGDTVIYTVKSINDCYYINDEILVDGVAVEFTTGDSTRATYAFEAINSNHTIVANAAIYRYAVTTTVNDNTLGEITPGDTTLDCGSDYAYVVTPITGYHIDSVKVNGVMQTITDSSTFSSTIEDIHTDTTIAAYFSINHYMIVASTGDNNGTIDPVDTIVYEYGATPTYIIKPNDCYYISEVLVDGTAVEFTTGDSTYATYTFDAIDASHTIVANFAIYKYDMTADFEAAMGTVTTATDINCGADYQYMITANEGFHIVSYTIGGVTVTNTMEEPNDYIVDSVLISPVSQDTNLVVEFDTNTYTVSVCADAVNGSLVVNDPTEVNYNEGTTVTVVADTANGYHIASITDSRGITVPYGHNTDKIATYNVDNVVADDTVCATFELNTFTIHTENGENGTITPSNDTIVTYGDVVDFVIEPNSCYYISNILVDGESVWTGYTDSVSAYTLQINVSEFDPAVETHTIATEYTIFQYTMTSTVNDATMGTVTPTTTVECGSTHNYEIEATTGYHIDHVILDNVQTDYEGQQNTATITVTDIRADHQLDVFFAKNRYTVTATAGEHGTITPSGVTTVEHGASLTYTIAPDPCYYIDSVLVNGEVVEFTTGDSTGGTYTFASVEDTMTIHADFHIYEYRMMAEYDEEMGSVETGIATCGSNYTYTIHANEGYHITSMRVGTTTHNNNVGLNTDTVATFNVYSVYQDTTCYVEFARNTYTVNFNVTGEGEVEPGNTTVDYDSTLAYTVTAGTGYHIVSITDNGTVVYTNDNRDTVAHSGSIANIRENHTIDVVFAINEYTITATAGNEGEIIPGTQTVTYGATPNVTIRTLEDCYYISRILVDGEEDTVFTNNETRYVYTFAPVDTDHVIAAEFGIRTYTVIVNADTNGTVDPSGDTLTYDCGATVTYTFTPNDGYEVVSVTVNGSNIGAQTSYTITNIQNDYTIDVVFGQTFYTLTSVAYGHGTIDPLGETTVLADSSMTYTLTPDDCYTVSEVLVNGVSYLNNEAFDGETLTFDSVTSDMTIQAYFQIKTYTVETEANEGGTITETAVYDCGTDVVINITPDACHTLDSVMVDTTVMTDVTEVSFNALDTNHTVMAYFSMKTYAITASVNDTLGGTITPTDTFDCGERPTYEITANDGYHIDSVMVDGVYQGAIGSYTFSSLDADHEIMAVFAKDLHHLTAYANAGVRIEPVADTTVEHGTDFTFYFTIVDTCYEIENVTVDGESIGAVDSVAFDSVITDHVVNVTTTLKTYTITATAMEGGTITPAGALTVECGGTQSFSITPAVGYTLDSVMVDSENVGEVYNYVFSDVHEDHTIEVFFSAIDTQTYTIHAEAGEHGTITPEGDSTVVRGSSVTYVFTADEYYSIDSVIVDGNVLPTPVRSYTFSNVTDDHTIRVTFVADEVGCTTPNIVYTTNITESSATFNWNETGASSYTIRYKKLRDTSATAYTVVTGLTGGTYDVTGLEEATEYVWSVKAVCVDSVAESAWSVSVSFVTEEPVDTTDIHNAEMSVINVYSYGNDIYVTNESNEQIKDVQVYDINGRLVHRGMAQSNPEVINVTTANGIYIVRVVTETMVRNFKVSITQR